jgi:WhiB family redox-sensing transcriptional regulator
MWRNEAACRDEKTDLFFPIGEVGPAARQIHDAKQICAVCPVREPCLQWALEVGADHGVWGGLSEAERKSWRRRQARTRTRRSFVRWA